MFGIISSFFNMGISEEEYLKLRGQVYEENHKNLIFLSRILSVLLVPGVIFVYFYYGGISTNFWIYLSLQVCLILSFVYARTAGRRENANTLVQIYVFISILIGYSIVLSTIMNPNMMAVKYIAFIMVLPMFFTDRPVRISLYICACTALFIVSAVINDDTDIISLDVFQAIIFGTVSIVASTYLTRLKIQRLYYEGKWKYISETDLMTGLNSRNLYEREISSYPRRCRRNLICVFLDVNGLHEVDIKQGYDAGDRILKTSADIFQHHFGNENTYRIGGDEFVAFVPDCHENDIRNRMRRIYGEIEAEGFSVSMGMSEMKKEDIDMSALTKKAANEMSEVKRLHYQRAENDRRRR